MSFLRKPKKVKCIVCLFAKEAAMLDISQQNLVKKLGRTDYRSDDFKFDETSYYKDEMGEDLIFRIVSFYKLIERTDLPRIKNIAWQIEKKYSSGGKRKVNIDPGILSLENFILATGKGYGHRIYLGKGVYADLTLIYKKDGFAELPWTYLNYRSEIIKTNLINIRNIYHKQI